MPLARMKTSSPAFGMAAGIGLLLLASGCARVTNTQGYIFDPELVSSVAPGVDNKQSVRKTLGRPTIISQWDENSWYYVSRETKQFAFLRPKPIENTVLHVRFGPDGTVQNVEKRGLEQVVDIDPHSDKTRTLGRETGILQDLFGNIGQVGTAAPAGGP